jgi:hypothetical protein
MTETGRVPPISDRQGSANCDHPRCSPNDYERQSGFSVPEFDFPCAGAA